METKIFIGWTEVNATKIQVQRVTTNGVTSIEIVDTISKIVDTCTKSSRIKLGKDA